MPFITLREHLGKAFTANRLVFAKQLLFIALNVAKQLNHIKKLAMEPYIFHMLFVLSEIVSLVSKVTPAMTLFSFFLSVQVSDENSIS